MRVMFVIAAASVALLACTPPAAQKEAAPKAETPKADAPPTAPALAPARWALTEGDPMTLRFQQGDAEIDVACPEGKKQLRISFAPAWEVPGGVAPNASTATIVIGAKTYEAKADAASLKDSPLMPVYVLPANADTVTALMISNNLGLRLKSGDQELMGEPDSEGAFDMFATTCAQINGLK